MRAFLTSILSLRAGDVLRRRRRVPFAQFLAQAAHARWPDALVVSEHQELRIAFEDRDVIAPFQTLERSANHNPEQSAALVQRWLLAIDEARERRVLAELSLADALPRVLPMPLPCERVDAEGPFARAKSTNDQPTTERPGAKRDEGTRGHMSVAFVIDAGPRVLPITQADLERWRVPSEELREVATDNLWHLTRGASILQEDLPGREVYQIRQGDGWDAARLALPGLWSRLAESCGAPLVLAVPERDRVYAARADQPRSVERLAEHVARDYLAAERPISPAFWCYESERLQRWTPHA